MSIYSDYKCGAMSDWEYRQACARENRKEREYEQDIFERETYSRSEDHNDNDREEEGRV